ncbi:hypothetical protein [Phaffia rhodozyma]|uniref:Uncharacterized protein n=1 Tax=Phaffia rhodozyma TaxID=264483 RepID=A0A0F7SMC6_PHARH|nr:hypothetical protein [Phaffia rhodozyma]
MLLLKSIRRHQDRSIVHLLRGPNLRSLSLRSSVPAGSIPTGYNTYRGKLHSYGFILPPKLMLAQ